MRQIFNLISRSPSFFLLLYIGPSNKNSTQHVDVTLTNQIQCITQLILSLDMEQWESLVEVFQIKKSMIKNE